MTQHFLVRSCDSCAYRGPCGGLDGGQSVIFGCFINHHHPCDFTCPCRPAEFRARLREVGGLESRAWSPLNGAATRFPTHIPVMRHGRIKGDSGVGADVVGISIRDLFGRRSVDAYRPIAESYEELCAKFHLRPGTALILISVAQDRYIERYWAMRNVAGFDLAQRLAKLKFAAVTVPNYSYFSDAPRTDILWNRKRAMIVAEELSAAGVPVIPHLNAITESDWRFWEDVLLSQKLTVVAKEFQTGLRVRELGIAAIDRLQRLQERIGRDLHPLVIGGAQYNTEFARRFASHSIVDSHAFMTSVNRRAFEYRNGRLRRQRISMPVGELLPCNVRFYRRHLADLAAAARDATATRIAG